MIVPDITRLSPNFYPAPVAGRTVIIHATRSGIALNPSEFNGTLNYMTTPGTVSSHWVIARDGRTARIVADDVQAWHAQGDNDNAWGIELEQDVEADGFTEPQLRTLVAVCRGYVDDFGVAPVHATSSTQPGFIGHQETAQGRRTGKSDPGRLFPWDEFIAALRADEPREEEHMSNPVWATWGGRPDHVPYRTYLLFATPAGLKKDFVESIEQHGAIQRSGIAGDQPRPMSLADLRQFEGSPEPDEL